MFEQSTSLEIYFRHYHLKLQVQASMSMHRVLVKKEIIVYLTKLELRGNDGRIASSTYWFREEGKGRFESKSHTWRTLPCTFLCEFKNDFQETIFKRCVNEVNPYNLPVLTLYLKLLILASPECKSHDSPILSTHQFSGWPSDAIVLPRVRHKRSNCITMKPFQLENRNLVIDRQGTRKKKLE